MRKPRARIERERGACRLDGRRVGERRERTHLDPGVAWNQIATVTKTETHGAGFSVFGFSAGDFSVAGLSVAGAGPSGAGSR